MSSMGQGRRPDGQVQSPISPPRSARAVSLPPSAKDTAFEEKPDASRGQPPEPGADPPLDQTRSSGVTEETAKEERRGLFGRKKGVLITTPRSGSLSNGLGREVHIHHGQKGKSTRILYTTDEEVRDALLEFGVFIIFLVLTSLVTLSVRHPHMFYFNDTIKKLFATREMVVAPSVTVCFEKILTVPDWWDYLVYNFIKTLHGDLTITTEAPNDTATGNQNAEALRQASEDHWNVEDGYVDRDYDESQKRNGELEQRPQDAGLEDIGGAATLEALELDEQTFYDKRAGFDGSASTRQNSKATTHLAGRVYLLQNLLLGPPRLRQIRVRRESCQASDDFVRHFNTCYSAYSAGMEEKTGTHKGTEFYTMGKLNATPIWTVLAFYSTGGYIADLTYDKDDNLEKINKLRADNWLDRGSRLCLMEFNLYNKNTDIFQSVKLLAEIPPTGGVIPQTHLQTVKQYSFFNDTSQTMTVIYIFWYIMVAYYTICEVNGLRKSGITIYYRSLLNVLDSIVLVLCYLALIYNVWHTFQVGALTRNAKRHTGYQSIDVLCFVNIIYVDMMAILAFLVWIKIFKFISFNKTLVQFTTTLRRCSKDLAGFSLMFGIVFLAYAQLGLLLFGTKHPDFHNFVTSVLTMIRMILGDFQYNLIEQANRVLGPIYFLTYILLVFFILLNMFLAIIMETYNSVKSEITQGRSHLGSYIYKKLAAAIYWIVHCGRKGRVQPTRRAASVNETDVDGTIAEFEEPKVLANITQADARYFEEVPPDVQNKELFHLTNRVTLIEEILEQLVTNMDDVLKRIEREQGARKH
ncbi:polycystic kidney disease 2-like 1 protein [Drosophila pseudoobscura]|uniref:Polycystic kidney disease 2-like 1 protein n=1 Tax=Drosophila pseudoobscura pseudoobscura TaxID=46245 RepID=A0A6I8V023_DROPS|nr:polycystic kidney disease 2-like 1 protein [Drosophila pseudoobscura]XP_033239769.1 polycystic kidney disease 2-like 1 protein [Drosophila pseudoobscura]